MKSNLFYIFVAIVCLLNHIYLQTIKIINELFSVSFENTSLDVVLHTNIVQNLNRYFAYTKSFDYDLSSYKEERGKRLFYYGRPISRCKFPYSLFCHFV